MSLFIAIMLSLAIVFVGIMSNVFTGNNVVDLKRKNSKFLLISILVGAVLIAWIQNYIAKNRTNENMVHLDSGIQNLPDTASREAPGENKNKITGHEDSLQKSKIITPVQDEKNDPVEIIKPKQETFKPERKLVSDYIITISNQNQLKGLLEEIQNVVEAEGYTVVIDEHAGTSFSQLKGSYKKLIVVSSSLGPSATTTTDQRFISTPYSYIIKSYDVETTKLINSIHESDALPGNSAYEIIENIKKSILPKIISLL